MMTLTFEEVLRSCRRIEASDLTLWVERHWVRPRHRGGTWMFNDIDVARIELICDMRHDMDLNDEAVPVVLALLDAVHDLRRRLSLLAAAIGRLPPEGRAALIEAVRDLESMPGDADEL